MQASFALIDSAPLRYSIGALAYFAQGIPQGLLSIAMPAWLAARGASAGEVASYLAVIVLPWAFKLVTGPLMDRFEFLPMGRRRPWALAAQFGLTVAFLALAFIVSPVDKIGALMAIGALINAFAATQDVAIDGMAIDVTPIREQGRLNAFMSFGKAAGWSLSAAVSGVLLETAGLQMTAVVAAVVSGLMLLLMIGVRERAVERILPWTAGRAAGTAETKSKTFRDVFAGLNRVMWAKASLIVIAVMFVDGMIFGYGHALMPFAAVNLFDYTTAQWSQLVATMGIIGAFIALGLGPFIDRMGAKLMLMFAVALVGVHALMLAQTQDLWENSTYVKVMLSAWVALKPVVMVCSLALAMTIVSSAVSATQFAIYMSISNFGYAFGSKLFGVLSEHANFVQNYLTVTVLTVVLLLFLSLHRHRVTGEDGSRTKTRLRPTHTIPLDGPESGLFLSGAMRCPKCRSDMEAVGFDGIEIDRCNNCHGIWFDEGELEPLATRAASRAIDTGSKAGGAVQNRIDDYHCPRCSGVMIKRVDATQPHIWYETCSACSGSFLDAGELTDLASLTPADIVRRFRTPART